MGVDVLESLKRLVDGELHPALKAAGLRRRGRVWSEGSAEAGWCMLDLQRWSYNTRTKARFTINTSVWPPGTAEVHDEIRFNGAPFAAANAPFYARPPDIAPEQYPEAPPWRWWQPSRPDASWWDIGRLTRFGPLGDELVRYCVEHALPWARARLDPSFAADELIAGGERSSLSSERWDLICALATLERAGLQGPRFDRAVADLGAIWSPDPRPPELGPLLERWRSHGAARP